MADVIHPALARYPSEDAQQHAALLEFAAAGPARKKAHLARTLGVHIGTISKWASRFKWKERLANYDIAAVAGRTVNAAKVRTEAIEELMGKVPMMIQQLLKIMFHPDTPQHVRLQALLKGLELTGVITKQPDVESLNTITTMYLPPERPSG